MAADSQLHSGYIYLPKYLLVYLYLTSAPSYLLGLGLSRNTKRVTGDGPGRRGGGERSRVERGERGGERGREEGGERGGEGGERGGEGRGG